ncbi:photosystem II protein Psb27 [Prochlorococcus sp. MIT 1223]|uniref:photosystem II protein Psb27 n=1 Tax=Prochlorococcus sp. MIT 1223 TaxID=3096217 RepID=UPI002A74D728|nr:photosystem II protein Psb27 [Prochlorococcus sp. MIT 1223]
MIYSLHPRILGVLKSVLSLCICALLAIFPFGISADAGRTSMTGDYSKDTMNVAKVLKASVVLPESDQEESISDEETVFLITDYISRYRNRSQVNKSVSFTTMQTALNSLAGHYKTFPNRPVPENLKNRLEEELSKAEALVLKQS